MIYNNTYFNEQLKKTYIEGKKGEITLVFCVVIMALITLVTHNFFFTMRDTIVGSLFPHLVKYTIFSMMSVYNVIIIIFFVSLCIIKYKRVTIAEISTNKWYLLIKSGRSPKKLVFDKLSANVLSMVFIYSLTFILLIFLGTLMDLTMNINAIFSLAILGLIQLFFVVMLIMGISVFVGNRYNCLLLVLLGLVFMYALAEYTNFDLVMTSVVMMEDTSYLFTKSSSLYVYVLLAISVAMLFLGGIKGHIMAVHYKPKAQLGENVYSVSYLNNKSKFLKYHGKPRTTLFSIVAKTALVLIVFSSILANMGIIMLATFNKEDSNLGNHIMVVFESETMTGQIDKNDFAVFEKTKTNEKFKLGDVVLYYENSSPVVQKIESFNEDGTYTVDFIKYPHGKEDGSASKDIFSRDIDGKLIGKSGWLGAFIIWNKTVASKILTTMLPTLLLIFYDKIEGIFRFVKATAGTDEEDDDIAIKM